MDIEASVAEIVNKIKTKKIFIKRMYNEPPIGSII